MRVRTGTFAEEFADGKPWLELEGPLDVDLVIALPPFSGPRLAGLPGEPDVAVDPFGRVRGARTSPSSRASCSPMESRST